jgi:hypothetical protein
MSALVYPSLKRPVRNRPQLPPGGKAPHSSLSYDPVHSPKAVIAIAEATGSFAPGADIRLSLSCEAAAQTPGKDWYGLPVAPVLSWLAQGVRPGAHFRPAHDHATRLDFALHALSQSFNIDLSGRRNSPALDFRQHRDNEFGGLV